jgi:hypothetical protein
MDERLNVIVVVQAPFRDQVLQLIQWSAAKDLLLAAAREDSGNDSDPDAWRRALP